MMRSISNAFTTKFVSDQDECPVCMEPFSDTVKKTTLDCGHFVCLTCMESLIIPLGSSRHVCPLCRKKGGFHDGEKYTCRNTTASMYADDRFTGRHGMHDMLEFPIPEESEMSFTYSETSVANRVSSSGEIEEEELSDIEQNIQDTNHVLHLSTRGMDFFDISDFLKNIYEVEHHSFIEKLQKTMSIVFCLDATSSMGPFITASKKNISGMVKEFLTKNPDFHLKVYIIVFYDFDQHIVQRVFKHMATADNTEQIDTFLNTIEPEGGGDEAEELNTSLYIACGGIQTDTNMGPLKSIKISGNSMFVLSTDAFPHGLLQHLESPAEKQMYLPLSDSYGDIAPHGLKFVELLKQINTIFKNVCVFRMNTKIHHDYMIKLIKTYIPSTVEFNLEGNVSQPIIFRSASIRGHDSEVVSEKEYSERVGTIFRSITRSCSGTC